MPRRSSRKHLLFFLLVGLACASAAQAFDLQAHRGGRGLRPENTLAAFAYALDLGVTTLELDLAVTRDRVLVISHGPYLDYRLARGPDGEYVPREPRRFIKDLTLAELKRYTVGELNPKVSYGYAYPDQVSVPGQTVPALAELFELVRSRGDREVRFNIEIKTYPPFPGYTVPVEEFAALLVDLVAEYGLKERVTVQSFDWRALQEVQRLAPGLEIACLAVRSFTLDGEPYNLQPGRPGPSAWLAGLDVDEAESAAALTHRFGAQVFSPYYKEVTRADIAAAHRLGLRVLPWTVNDERQMRSLISWGVDGLITDRPDILKALLEELGLSW